VVTAGAVRGGRARAAAPAAEMRAPLR